MFLTIRVVNKDIKSKTNFADNYDYNILRFFDVRPNFPFTTREKKSDY